MEINHVLTLKEGKFNVPTHVLNPYQKYVGEICLTLRDYVFPSNSKVTLLVEIKEGNKEFRSLSIQDASLIATTFEKRGYRAMILEQPEYEFFGEVSWDSSAYVGCLEMNDGDKVESHLFSFIESLIEVKWRSIARLAQAVQGYLDVPAVELNYIWSSKFVGVNQSKLIVCDYKFL